MTSPAAIINPLSPNGFRLSIQKLPEMIYFSQSVNLPGISLPNIPYANMFSTIPVTGSTLQFDALMVEFMVDEKMANYSIIYNWLIAMGYPQSFQQYITFQDDQAMSNLSDLAKNYSDGTLQILDSYNNVVKTITFIDLIPTNLTAVTFSSTNSDVNYITATMTLEYNMFTIS